MVAGAMARGHIGPSRLDRDIVKARVLRVVVRHVNRPYRCRRTPGKIANVPYFLGPKRIRVTRADARLPNGKQTPVIRNDAAIPDNVKASREREDISMGRC